MNRKTWIKGGSSCPGLTCLVLKLSAFILFFSGLIINVVYYMYKVSAREKNPWSIGPRSLITNNCEFTKQMVEELHLQLAEKDILLTHHKDLIESLNVKLNEYNQTNIQLKNTLRNLSDVLKPSAKPHLSKTKQNINTNSTWTSTPTIPTPYTLPYPGNLKDNVEKVSRPCCLALKRMTDILRLYMEKTQDLREEIKYYQHLNHTELNQDGDSQIDVDQPWKCTKHFHEENKNWTHKTDKHAIYQTYLNGFFYESPILNRDIPKQKLKSKTSHRTLDFTKVSKLALDQVAEETKLEKNSFRIVDGLLRYDELAGAEYKLTFKYNNSRTFMINLIKPFGRHIRSNKLVTELREEKELINIIVPITGRTAQLTNFLRDLGEAVLMHKENIFLTVVIYGKDPENKIKSTVKKFSLEHNFGNYDVFKKDVPFNRGRALHDGITRWNGYNNVLVFLCDIDIKFRQPFLQRCRKYTEPGKTVYMPIVFSLYNPNIVFAGDEVRYAAKALNISAHTGTWRPLGYGMVCAYKLDYLKTNGFNLNINGWGGEDVSLYHRFRKKGLRVIRAPDPDLYHIWHPKYCSTKLSKRQYETCIGSKARYEGSQRQLGIVLLSRQIAASSQKQVTDNIR